MLNQVILMGRLTRDPELRYTASDIPVVTFTIAVDRGYRTDGQSVDYINIVAWRDKAEFVTRWFSKGQLIAVRGSFQVRSYKDREGKDRTAHEVLAEEVFFCDKPKKETEAKSADIPEEDTEELEYEELEYEELEEECPS